MVKTPAAAGVFTWAKRLHPRGTMARVSHVASLLPDHAVVRAARGVLAAAALCVSIPAAAWSNHALCTWPALAALREVADAPPVAAETLEQ